MGTFAQLIVGGLALGAIYALVVMGFVIVYRASDVFNFAQIGFVVIGAYVAYNYINRLGIPFWSAVLLSLVTLALLAVAVEVLVISRMVGRPSFAIIMVTIGLLFVLEQIASMLGGRLPLLALGDPWGLQTATVLGVRLKLVDLWIFALTGTALLLVMAFIRYTWWGLGMRLAAADPETAMAQGISVKRVLALSWAIAGILGALAGILLSAGPSGVTLGIGWIALRALPAMIIGGLESPVGGVIGGLLIGTVEVLTAGYINPNFPWLGQNFHVVMPYLLMAVFMLVRPHGLFGTQHVYRA